MTKKVRLTESQLVDLIEKLVKENQMVGMQGFKTEPAEAAQPEAQPSSDSKPKKEKSTAQKYYDSLAKFKTEVGKLNHNLKGEKDAVIKNKFSVIDRTMTELQELLGKRDDVNKM